MSGIAPSSSRPTSPLDLVVIGASAGALPARHAVDGQALRAGTIAIAPPDQHMLVEGDRIRLQHGPKEHHARPAIDPLFRSAARAQGAHVIGVLLSGCLDDGTAGLRAIKQCGGVAVVQDPADAEHPEMPRSALAHVDVDYCVSGPDLADTLLRLVARQSGLMPAATVKPDR